MHLELIITQIFGGGSWLRLSRKYCSLEETIYMDINRLLRRFYELLILLHDPNGAQRLPRRAVNVAGVPNMEHWD